MIALSLGLGRTSFELGFVVVSVVTVLTARAAWMRLEAFRRHPGKY